MEGGGVQPWFIQNITKPEMQEMNCGMHFIIKLNDFGYLNYNYC
jgi:hypothetical protein